MSETDLIFEEPKRLPNNTDNKRGRKPGDVSLWLDKVRQHPHRWVVYDKVVTRHATRTVRRGGYANVKPGEFDAVFRSNLDGFDVPPDGRGYLVVRFVG